MSHYTITWTGRVADMKVCHLNPPSREKLPGGMQWATASNCSAFKICLGVQIKTRISLSSSLERLSPACVPEHGNFLPNSKLSCEQSLHQWSPLGWDFLRAASESEALVAQFFIFRFRFHKCQLALQVFSARVCSFCSLSCTGVTSMIPLIFNSTLVSAFRRTWTYRKNWVSVCVIYLSGGPSSKTCNLIIFHMPSWELYYCYPACSAFPLPYPIKACSKMNLRLLKIHFLL